MIRGSVLPGIFQEFTPSPPVGALVFILHLGNLTPARLAHDYNSPPLSVPATPPPCLLPLPADLPRQSGPVGVTPTRTESYPTASAGPSFPSLPLQSGPVGVTPTPTVDDTFKL
jgi:hypothetical protein